MIITSHKKTLQEDELYLTGARIEMSKPFIHHIIPLCYAMFFNFHKSEADELVCSDATIKSKNPFHEILDVAVWHKNEILVFDDI